MMLGMLFVAEMYGTPEAMVASGIGNPEASTPAPLTMVPLGMPVAGLNKAVMCVESSASITRVW